MHPSPYTETKAAQLLAEYKALQKEHRHSTSEQFAQAARPLVTRAITVCAMRINALIDSKHFDSAHLKATLCHRRDCCLKHATGWAENELEAAQNEIAALESICIYAPEFARLCGAACYVRCVGNEDFYSVPSESKPGQWHQVKNYAPSSSTWHCGCPASSECWHQRNAKHLAELRRFVTGYQVDFVSDDNLDTSDTFDDVVAAQEREGELVGV